MFLVIILSLSISCVLPGSVQVLDQSNFDRVALNTSINVLVEFYVPSCEECRQLERIYEKVAETFKNEKDCIVAKVDANNEKDLESRFRGKKYPLFRFFSKQNKDGRIYLGGRSEEDFINFLNRQCGTSRVTGGGLDETVGRLDIFDEIAEKFMSDINREKLISAMERHPDIESYDKKTVEYYVKSMKKVVEKGASYIQVEISRLQKILDGI